MNGSRCKALKRYIRVSQGIVPEMGTEYIAIVHTKKVKDADGNLVARNFYTLVHKPGTFKSLYRRFKKLVKARRSHGKFGYLPMKTA